MRGAWGGDQSFEVKFVAFTWPPLGWFQSEVVQTKKELLCCSVFELGARKGLQFRVACVSVMFITVKSRKFAGLICLLFPGRDNFFFFFPPG